MLLKVKFNDQSEAKPFKGGPNHTKKYEILLKKTLNAWEWAVIYGHGVNAPILHYYHHTTGLNQLNLEQYQRALNSEKVNLYIVFTSQEKKRRGNDSGETVYNSTINAMASYFTKGVAKVMAYKNNKLVETYKG